MRSLSKIKESVDHRTQPQSPLNKSVIISPAQIRSVKADPDITERKSLAIQNKRIKDLLFLKQKEIEKLNNTIVQKVKDAIAIGDDIIQAARKRADVLVSEAEKTATTLNDLVAATESQKKILDQKEQELNRLDTAVNTKQQLLDSREFAIAPKEYAINVKQAEVDTKTKEADTLLHAMGLLFLAALQRCEAISTISDELLDKLSQNIAKADKMYLEALQIESQNVAEKKLNEARSAELDGKEKWLLDRERTIRRSANEIKRNKK